MGTKPKPFNGCLTVDVWARGASDQLHRCAAQEKTTELLLSRLITVSPFLNGLLKEKETRFLHKRTAVIRLRN